MASSNNTDLDGSEALHTLLRRWAYNVAIRQVKLCFMVSHLATVQELVLHLQSTTHTRVG